MFPPSSRISLKKSEDAPSCRGYGNNLLASPATLGLSFGYHSNAIFKDVFARFSKPFKSILQRKKIVLITVNMLYIYNTNTILMKSEQSELKKFDTKKSVDRAKKVANEIPTWKIVSEGKEYTWTSKLDRVTIIRKGIPYESIDGISKRINVPIKDVLTIFGLPQTTYNKKRREHSLLSGRDSEVVLLITELLDFGIEVFNNETEKFQRWMKKENASLGGNSPESLLDSVTGIQEVKNCLNRIEFGNFA